MTLGIMQPYFFPYIGYFSLIQAVDQFILFDEVQFIRHGWIERNRILSTQKEPIYIRVPLVKKSRDTKIIDMELNQELNWKEKILSQLNGYRKAPHYSTVRSLIEDSITYSGTKIIELNKITLSSVCEYLDINTEIVVWSEMGISIEDVNEPDEWALNISKSLNATHYINPENGESFFSRKKFNDAGIEINFLKSRIKPYKQNSDKYIPYLSIIDTLMYCSKDEVKEKLLEFELS